jgi:hypothetical protein
MKTIPLTRGLFAIVDDADYEWLSKFKWHAIGGDHGKAYYAARRVGGNKLKMQYMLMDKPYGMTVDHRNGNSLDYRRSNLRHATFTQQCQNRVKPNRLGTKGVFQNNMGRFTVRITINKKRLTLGTYATLEEAARMYNQGAILHFGEFARLNPV